MQGTTLAIALLGSVLALSLRPPYALAAYVAALVWYPDFLRVSIGTIDISVGRIVVTVLLLRCLCDDRLRRGFVWCRLDTWVVLSMVVYVGMFLLTRPLAMAFENRAGFLMDTFLSYMVVRFIVTNKTTLVSFVKSAGLVIAGLAIIGVIESVVHWQPYLALRRFRPWTTASADQTYIPKGRWGFARANGPFNHSILFGNCFVMFLPLIWALRHQRDYWGKLAYPLSLMAVLGALSSMSSGPWATLVAVIFCLAVERYKRWTKLLLMAILGSFALIAIISNRPFYHVVVSYANPLGGAGWQRARIVDCAIEDFGDWWVAGYGGRDPGWGPKTGTGAGGRTDLNNEFILAGCRYGILGIVVLCMVLTTAFCALVHAFKETPDKELRSLYWALGSALIGVIVAWQGVSFFGQMSALFYSILGIVGITVGSRKDPRLSCRNVAQKGNNLALY